MKEFSEDEKVIAMHINKKYKWMARDKDGELFMYVNKPTKRDRLNIWTVDYGYLNIKNFIDDKDMFKNIKWEDDGPTRISDIYGPQILDDAEREYLKAVLKPFHEKIEYVVKHGDEFADDGTYHKEFLFIAYSDGNRDKGYLTFPDFDAGKAYSGMELGKRYKLGELGITYKEVES